MSAFVKMTHKDLEIDLRAIREFCIKRAKYILLVLPVVAVVTVLVYVVMEKEYEVTMSLQIEVDEADAPSAIPAAGLFGDFSLGTLFNTQATQEDFLNVQNMMRTYPFLQPIVHEKLHFSTLNKTYTLVDYLQQQQTTQTASSPSSSKDSVWLLVTSLNPQESYRLRVHKKEYHAVSTLRRAIELEEEEEDALIHMGVRFTDPEAAYQLAHHILDRLTHHFAEFHALREQNKLRGIENRFKEAKTKYEEARKKQAQFEDEHKDITSSLVTVEREHLQMETRLKYKIYGEVSLQKEQIETKLLGKNTFISIIKAGMMPTKPVYSPILFIILGMVSAFLLTLMLIFFELMLRFFGYRYHWFPFLISKSERTNIYPSN